MARSWQAWVPLRLERHRGLASMVFAGALWAALCAWLAIDGQSPSKATPFIPGEKHYLMQAVYILPLLLVGWQIFGRVAFRLVRRAGGGATKTQTLQVTGLCYGLSLALLFVVPDLVVYGLQGFSGMGPLLRFTGPLVLVVALGSSVWAVARLNGMAVSRALFPVAIAFVVQLAVVSTFVR